MQVRQSPSLEERVAKVEGILEEIRSRLNHVETEISQLRQDMNREIGSLRQAIQTNFRWTLGIMLGILIPMWVTIIFAILSH